MPCLFPKQAVRSIVPNSSGKFPLIFNSDFVFQSRLKNGSVLYIPCKQCKACRIKYSLHWAVRCMHEAKLYDFGLRNSFITLTYNNQNLPPGGSLRMSDFQNFMKRLRLVTGPGVRYFYCGEYGETYGRPHYHAIIFNFDFPDKYPVRTSPVRDGTGARYVVYRSDTLDRIWSINRGSRSGPIGHCEIGSVTFQSAAYIARYIFKKRNGVGKQDYYRRLYIDPETQTVRPYQLVPEYAGMSRRPGIGSDYFDLYYSDWFKSDDTTLIFDGKRVSMPSFYERKYEILMPDDYKAMKENRLLYLSTPSMIEHIENPDRRIAHGKRLDVRFSKLVRSLD